VGGPGGRAREGGRWLGPDQRHCRHRAVTLWMAGASYQWRPAQ
jgi:hypothetical protein